MRKLAVRCLLVAAWTMLVETACSHTPKEPVAVDIWKPRAYQELQRHEGEDGIFRIYTSRNQVVATRSYTLTDSTVVIHDLLLDGKYYDKTGNTAIPQTHTPFEIPADDLAKVEKYDEHTGRKAALLVAAGAAGFVALGFAIYYALISTMDF